MRKIRFERIGLKKNEVSTLQKWKLTDINFKRINLEYVILMRKKTWENMLGSFSLVLYLSFYRKNKRKCWQIVISTKQSKAISANVSNSEFRVCQLAEYNSRLETEFLKNVFINSSVEKFLPIWLNLYWRHQEKRKSLAFFLGCSWRYRIN